MQADGTALPGSYSTIINAGCEIPDEAAKIHGITTAIAREKGVPAKTAMWHVYERVYALISLGWPIVGYNIGTFDAPLALTEMGRHGLNWPTETCRLVDPLVLDRHLDRYRKGGRKLEAVARHYGVWVEGAHDAFIDCCMTAGVLREIVRRYPDLRKLNFAELISYQATAHKEWATSMTEHFKSKGRNDRIEFNGWPEIAPAKTTPHTGGSGEADRTKGAPGEDLFSGANEGDPGRA